MSAVKLTGVIQTYFPGRKYGFVAASDGSIRFFHESNFTSGVPHLGDKIEFELGDPIRLGKQEQATNIVVIEVRQ
jgi:cold shock CspA family protein